MKKTLLLLLALTSLGAYAQKKQLYLNLKKDSTYYLTFDIAMNIDQLIQGTHQIINTTMTGSTSHKVVGIRDTVYDMEVAYRSMSMVMSLGDRKIEMSSTGDTSNIMTKAVQFMLNKPFEMTITKRGQILEVKNFDKLFTGDFNASKITAEQKAQLMAQLRQSFAGNSLKSNLQETFIIYPKKALGVNDTWADRTNLEAAGMSSKIKNTYTVNNVTNSSY